MREILDNYPEFEQACIFGPNDKPGVYGIFEGFGLESKVIYIGSSKNIKKRVLNPSHHYMKCFENERLVYIRSIFLNDYISLEKKLIWKYRPELNLKFCKP